MSGTAGSRTAVRVRGPWSLATSRRFWEGFTPAALAADAGSDDESLTAVFLAEHDWRPVTARVEQHGDEARLELTGDGDLAAAAGQVARFLAIDVDGTAWPEIGRADPVLGAAQRRLPGFRPCGFFSPYEAAAWSVLSQRIRMVQAAGLRRALTDRLGEGGAFPSPAALRSADLDLPGRKAEYLRAVAEAALDGLLDGAALRALNPDDAVRQVQEITGIGPFAAELIVLRGANAPDALPRHERRLDAAVAERYGPDADLEVLAERWRPLRTWAAVHLRALAESGFSGGAAGPRT